MLFKKIYLILYGKQSIVNKFLKNIHKILQQLQFQMSI
ncbi:hypothetical protein pb186bvf_003395 [Paramecium bursaria]